MLESARDVSDEVRPESATNSPVPSSAPSAAEVAGGHALESSATLQSSPLTGMFSIEVRRDPEGRVVIMGKPTRKHVSAFLNIPICQQTRRRLDEQLVGSLSMATGALIEWALDELKRQAVAIEVRPRS